MTGDRNDRDQNDQTSLPTQMTATVMSPTLMTATKMTGHDEYQGVTMGQRAMISVFVFTSSTNFMGVFCSRFSFVFIALPL